MFGILAFSTSASAAPTFRVDGDPAQLQEVVATERRRLVRAGVQGAEVTLVACGRSETCLVVDTPAGRIDPRLTDTVGRMEIRAVDVPQNHDVDRELARLQGRPYSEPEPAPAPTLESRSVVKVQFAASGAARLCEWTTRSVGKRIAVLLDGEVLEAPLVGEPICSGALQIEDLRPGTPLSAPTLAAILAGGPLAAQVSELR